MPVLLSPKSTTILLQELRSLDPSPQDAMILLWVHVNWTSPHPWTTQMASAIVNERLRDTVITGRGKMVTRIISE